MSDPRDPSPSSDSQTLFLGEIPSAGAPHGEEPTPDLAFAQGERDPLAERRRAERRAEARRRRRLSIAVGLAAVLAALYFAIGFLSPESAGERDETALEPTAGESEVAPGTAAESGSETAGEAMTPESPPEPEPVDLEIASRPAGARILVDGTDTGERTPAELPFTPGVEYRLEIALEEHHVESYRFRVEDLRPEQRGEGRLFFPLETIIPPATVVVDAPYPVALTLGDRRFAASRRHAVELPPGKVTASLVAPEVFFRQTRRLELASAQRLELAVPAAVRVTITAYPGNCKVSIDGREVDFVPILDLRVVKGRHEIVFEWPALGASKTLEVELSQDQKFFARADD